MGKLVAAERVLNLGNKRKRIVTGF